MFEMEKCLQLARRTLRAEGDSVSSLVEKIDEQFADAVKAVYDCQGKVVLTGIGKAGIIARKISATLASTGTQSIFLHPVEALHGDLGRLQRDDVVVALSHSGESEEIIRLLDHVKARGAVLVAMTGMCDSTLGRYADMTICFGPVDEACPLGLAPTVSTTCMLALGDALALTVMEVRNFTPENYAVFHPGGALGRMLLLKVEEAMTFRVGDRLAVFPDDTTLAEALKEGEKSGRRAGAMLLVDSDGRLSGIITDGDLRRLVLRHRGEDFLARPVREYMTANPKRIHRGSLASEALAEMNKYRIDEMPVVDHDDHPVGLIDVQDLLGIKSLGNGKS
ncbi:MAG: SIS domain-containing protein [Phycisphaerae bacterium]